MEHALAAHFFEVIFPASGRGAGQHFAAQCVGLGLGDGHVHHLSHQALAAGEVDHAVAFGAAHEFAAIALGGAFDQDALHLAHQALADALDVAVDHGLQLVQAAQLDFVRRVVVQVGGGRARARAEDEAERVVEMDVVDELHHLGKIFLRLAGEADDEIAAHGQIGADGAHRIAALVPPPRTHRHRYFGVLAPNSPLRAAVTALAQPAASQPATVETAQPGAGVPGVAAPGNAATPTPEPEARPKRAAHYLWAVLIARIYEAFPLLCPMCGGQMRIIAFITHSAEIRHILNHIGVESAPPHITPARGPPLWEGCDAPVDDGAQGEPDWDLAAQPDEVDQRVNW
jgi:hypothetical protein